MPAAPIPAHEQERLDALCAYEILDTLPEKDFDDITQLAAYVCQAPTVLISLVDKDRQWFKSRHNLKLAETPREVAFCAHTILQSAPLIIPDASQDPRFSDNILVTGDLHLRFYAGAPLITPAGQNIGTLCLFDYIPRSITAEQINALQILSRQVINQLELRHQNRIRERTIRIMHNAQVIRHRNEELEQQVRGRTVELEQMNRDLLQEIAARKHAEEILRHNKELLTLITDYIPALIAYLSVDEEYLYVNQGYAQWFDCPKTEIIGKRIQDVLPATAYENARAHFQRALQGETITFENQVMDRHREMRIISAAYVPHKNAQGQVQAVVVMNQDITVRKRAEDKLRQSEEKLRAIFNTMHEGIALNEIVYDESGEMCDYRILEVNPAFYTMADYRPGPDACHF